MAIVFPIDVSFRQFLISLEIVILAIFLEIGIYFFAKYRNNRKNQNPSFVEFDWGVIFCAFGIAKIFFIASDFYKVNRNVVPVFGYITLSIAALIFLYHIESTKTLRTNFKLTIIMGIMVAVMIIVFIFAPSYVKTVAYTMSSLAYIILFVYLLVIIKRIWVTYRLYSIGLFCGIFFWLLGFMGTSDASLYFFGFFEIRIAGDFLIIAGLLFMGFFLNFIPSLAEIGWRDKIKYIILISEQGINLYSENFQEKKEINEVIVSGGLWGVQLFIKNVLEGAGNLKVIARGDDVILLDYGEKVNAIMVVRQELEILKFLLRNLVEKFEEFYGNILANWNGDTHIFQPVKMLIDDIFAIKKL
jgi:hypothetical protein